MQQQILAADPVSDWLAYATDASHPANPNKDYSSYITQADAQHLALEAIADREEPRFWCEWYCDHHYIYGDGRHQVYSRIYDEWKDLAEFLELPATQPVSDD